MELKSGSVTHIAELPGRVTPYETSDVRPQVGGMIVARRFAEGANVAAGQVLYQIEPAPYRAALRPGQGAAGQRQGQPRHAPRPSPTATPGLVKLNAVGQAGL